MDSAVVGGKKENINGKVKKITAAHFIALLYSKGHRVAYYVGHKKQNNSLLMMVTP